MTSVYTDTKKTEAGLWRVADNLRADFNLTSSGIAVQSSHFTGNEDGIPAKKAMFRGWAKNALIGRAASRADVSTD